MACLSVFIAPRAGLSTSHSSPFLFAPMPLAPLFADIFDAVHLQLGDPVISWLTPVWVIGVGAILGLLFCAVLWGIGNLLSRITPLANLVEDAQSRWVVVGALTLVYLA